MGSVSENISGASFRENLAFGQIAETEIAKWFMYFHGANVLPVYDVEYGHGKGPRVFSASCPLVAPDMIVWTKGKMYWIEAKHKTRFSWHYTTGRWTTGIDKHHFDHYVEVMNKIGVPVWLLFLHRQDVPNAQDIRHGCPTECPTGLFGRSLTDLIGKHNHISPPQNGTTGWGKYGMIYWNVETLLKIATLDEVLANQG